MNVSIFSESLKVMRTLNKLNYFMVGFPLIMAVGGLLYEEYLWIYGLLFTIVTGSFQVIVGLGMFINSGCRNKYLGIYLILVAVFFLLWTITDWKWVAALPPILAVYMTVLLFVESKNKTDEP